MIGINIRNFQHFFKNAENTTYRKVIFSRKGQYNIGEVIKLEKELVLVQNFYGNNIMSTNRLDVEKVISSKRNEYHKYIIIYDEIHLRQIADSWLLLPNDFDSNYQSFLNNNKKITQQVIGKYCYAHDVTPMYIYTMVNGSPNFFSWALINIYKNQVNVSFIRNILYWVENYNTLVGKLEKGSITSYNGYRSLFALLNEMNSLRKTKRANEMISFFNTAQKRIFKSIELNDEIITLLNKFYCLSLSKKKNFVQKMSTVTDINVIINNLKFLCDIHFKWSKESFFEYITNKNLSYNIIYNEKNIVILQVKDYDTIKYLAKTTNWCISKNKKYWNEYIENRDNSKQYILFDFNKNEDDEYSIVGFTVADNLGITNAHSFSNKNVNQIREQYKLKSFYPAKKEDIETIYSILDKYDISLNLFFSAKNNHYEWNKESFLAFLKKYYNDEEYTIFFEDESHLVISLYDYKSKFIINEDIVDAKFPEFMSETKSIIIFMDFEKQNDEKLLFGFVYENESNYEEFCHEIYNSLCNITNFTFNQLLNRYQLPFDIIKRNDSIDNIFRNAIVDYDINLMGSILQNKKNVEVIISNKRKIKELFWDRLIQSIFQYNSFDFINVIYDNHYTLYDFMDNDYLSSFIRDIISEFYNMQCEFRFSEIPSEDMITKFKNQKLEKKLYRYIAYFILLQNIVSFENINNETIIKNMPIMGESLFKFIFSNKINDMSNRNKKWLSSYIKDNDMYNLFELDEFSSLKNI